MGRGFNVFQDPDGLLDHWALRKISERHDWRDRFLRAFDTCGTLFFSVVHLAELASNSGASVDTIRSFLREIGPNWMVIKSDPNVVMDLEARWQPGARNFPWNGRVASGKIIDDSAARWERLARSTSGCRSANDSPVILTLS